MKSRSVGMALFVLLTVSVYGQPRIVAEVPFGFHIGNTRLAAGQYTLAKHPAPYAWQIQSEAVQKDVLRKTVFFLTRRTTAKAPQTNRLVFRRYGDTYFLAEVGIAGWPLGWAPPESNAEREAAKVARSVQTLAIAASLR